MAEGREQTRRIRCPYCGWERSITMHFMVDSRLTDVVRGWGEAFGIAAEKIGEILHNTELQRANAKFDLECPNCSKPYRFDAATGTVEP